jgi:hypothetical protein
LNDINPPNRPFSDTGISRTGPLGEALHAAGKKRPSQAVWQEKLNSGPYESVPWEKWIIGTTCACTQFTSNEGR